MSWTIIKKYAKYIAVLVLGVLLWVLYGLLVKKKTTDGGLPPDPAIWKNVEQAHEEALVARVEAKANSTAKKAELSKISEIKDGKERRQALARMLKGL